MRNYYYKDWELYLECRVCWEYKLSTYFSKHCSCKFWLRTMCRECDSLYWKDWRSKNHERHINSSRNWHEKNREKDREYNKEYRKSHKESWNRSWEKYPERKKARRDTYNYIKYHHIDKPTICSVCWDEWKIEIHHPDYSKWNNVVFCCKKCHALIHRGDAKCPDTIDLLNMQ